MSLTSFVGNKDVRERFKQEFPSPKFSVQKPLLAPPLTKHNILMGTAFDYLLRFYLKRLNPQAVESRWVAEKARETFGLYKGILALEAGTGKVCEAWLDLDKIPNEAEVRKADVAMFHKIKRILSEAKNAYKLYVKTGKITNALLTSAILLANLDIFFITRCEDYL